MKECDHVLAIGDTLYIEVQGGDAARLRCRVVDLKDRVLYTDYPINDETGKTTFLLNGTEINAFFSQHGQAYLFKSVLLHRKKETIPMLAFTLPEQNGFTKVQRREYVRVETDADAAIHSVSDAFKPFTALTVDLSAGGAAVKVPANAGLNENDQVWMWLSLHFQNGSIQYAKIQANVINAGKSGIAALEFTDMTETDRKQLLQYCFDQELLLKKKKTAAE